MKKQARKVLAEGRYLRMVLEGTWEYAERARGLAAVAIIAVTPHRELILTEQFRVSLKRNVIDLPAGLVGDEGEGDTLTAASRRELLEETGFKASRIKRVFQGPTSAGLSNEVVNLMLASGVRKVSEGGGVSGEKITVHTIPVDNVLTWCARMEKKNGTLTSPNVLAALALLPPANWGMGGRDLGKPAEDSRVRAVSIPDDGTLENLSPYVSATCQ